LSDPGDDGILSDDLAQKGFRPLDVDREVVVDDENSDDTFFPRCPFLDEQDFVDDTLIAAKSDRVAEEAGHGAKVAAIGTASSGFQRYDRNGGVGHPDFLQAGLCPARQFRHQVKLAEVNRVPGYAWIVL